MITLVLHLLRLLPFLFGGHRQVALKNLAVRQQLAVYKRTVTRPPLSPTDRLLGRAGQGLSRVETATRDRDPEHGSGERRRVREYWTKLSRPFAARVSDSTLAPNAQE
jgi:hypothetical protein